MGNLQKIKPLEKIPFHTYLIGEVNEANAKEVMKDIDEANQSKDVDRIILTVASGGGLLYLGFALYDHIKNSKKSIDTIAEGLCGSTAIVVLQAGRTRIGRTHTTFMIHPSSYGVKDVPFEEFMNRAEQYKKNHNLFVELTIERSGFKRTEFEKIYEHGKFLNASEALKFGSHGLIDTIEK